MLFRTMSGALRPNCSGCEAAAPPHARGSCLASHAALAASSDAGGATIDSMVATAAATALATSALAFLPLSGA